MTKRKYLLRDHVHRLVRQPDAWPHPGPYIPIENTKRPDAHLVDGKHLMRRPMCIILD